MKNDFVQAKTSSRRQFMVNTGAFTGSLALLAAFPSNVNAQQSGIADAGFSSLQAQAKGLIVFSENNKHCTEFASAFVGGDMSVVAMGLDPVRQWRDGLGAAVEQGRQVIVGLTTWADYVMMRELAIEQRRFPILEAQHYVDRGETTDWAAVHAVDMAQLLQGDLPTRKAVLASFRSTGVSDVSSQSLFSWVIA